MALDALSSNTRRATSALWIGLLAASCVLFSFALACATPFAALATIAGTRMNRRDAVATVTLAWSGNQAIGFLLRGYPRTWETFGWGLAIGIAAVFATLAADGVGHVRHRPIAVSVAALLVAFGLYEGTLFAATLMLPSGPGAFSGHVVLRIAEINLGAFVALCAVHGLVRLSLDRLARGRRPAARRAPTTTASIG